MPRIGEFLNRFRPAGAPGPATAGVPAEPGSGDAEELAPVFAALADTERECTCISRSATARAETRRAEAATLAAAVVADARAELPAVRALAAAQARGAAAAEVAVTMTAAEGEAGRIRAAGLARRPQQVEQVVAAVRAALIALPDGDRAAAAERTTR
jgi:hypothetical protein